MSVLDNVIHQCLAEANTRFDFWINFVNAVQIKKMAEVGVYRGNFAEQLLRHCASIDRYYMVDPWRHLDDWNKPANKDDDVFKEFFAETVAKTDFASEKRVILRGKTTEVIDHIPDSELDFAYIDGDHTLKGITIDLIRTFPKVRNGGWIGGDDFFKTIWQHGSNFEPTLVFPFAVHFAEAVGARIYALPKAQYLIQKNSDQSFAFFDLTRQYASTSLREQFILIKR